MSSDQYYHSVIHEDQFSDSVVIQPISLKPSVIPSFLSKNTQQTTILSTYDNIKLTQYIEQGQNGKIIKLINLQQNSLIASLTQQGNQFLQKFSSNQIAFITLIGQNKSGKSFFIDKWLNLSNLQGNKFCIYNQSPGIYVWSIPFVKEDLKIFIVQLANCQPESKQFDVLMSFVMLISSVVINLDNYKQKRGYQQSQKILEQKISNFSKRFMLNTADQNQSQFRNKLLKNFFPQQIINIKRRKEQVLSSNQNYLFLQTYSSQFYLPSAKNPQYRGIDQDLKIHSFLNKKCINEDYILKSSQLFKKIYSVIRQKKQGQLMFNGSILLKYLQKLEYFFNKKKQLNLFLIYSQIVKDLYINAYNYCVITYHQILQQSLSDQKPRSIDQLLSIFQLASNDIFQKYHQFSLDKQLHDQYEQKLIQHIESKQKLIIEINKKKAGLQLNKIYDHKMGKNTGDMKNIWKEIEIINKEYKQLSHGQDEVLGKKLVQYLPKLLAGSNEEQKIKEQVNQLNKEIQNRLTKLNQVKQANKQKRIKNTKMNEQISKKKNQLQQKSKQYDQKLSNIRKQLKIYSKNQNLNDDQLKQQIKKYEQMANKNDKTIQKLRQQSKQPVQNNTLVLQTKKQIQKVKKKQESIQMTLADLQKQVNTETKEGQKQQPKKQMKKSSEKNAIKQSKTSKQNKTMKQSKTSKK